MIIPKIVSSFYLFRPGCPINLHKCATCPSRFIKFILLRIKKRSFVQWNFNIKTRNLISNRFAWHVIKSFQAKLWRLLRHYDFVIEDCCWNLKFQYLCNVKYKKQYVLICREFGLNACWLKLCYNFNYKFWGCGQLH